MTSGMMLLPVRGTLHTQNPPQPGLARGTIDELLQGVFEAVMGLFGGFA